MANQSAVSPGMAWAIGALFGVVGTVPFLQEGGWLPVPMGAEGSRWLLVCAGALFLAGWLAIVMQYGLQRRTYARAVLQYFLFLVITGSMTALAGWVAFGSGERRFRTNVPFLSRQAATTLGRVGFGFATLLMFGMFVLFAVLGGHQLLKKFHSRSR